MELRGDTMGLRINVRVLAPLLAGAGLLASGVWVWRDLKRGAERRRVDWAKGSRLLFVLSGLLLIVSLALFLAGRGTIYGTNRAAVVLAIVQMLLVCVALLPARGVAR